MRKVRCVRGHFYDADMNTLCPHCGSPENKEEQKETVVESAAKEVSNTKSKKGIFGWKKPEKKEEKEMPVSGVEQPLEIVKEEAIPVPVKPVEPEEKKTHSFWTPNISAPATGNTPSMDFIQKEPVVEEPIRVEPQQVTPVPKTAPRDIDSVKTVSKFASSGGFEPVTGWLVCVKGGNYGKAFEIKAGQSSIGRDSSMDICIKEEGVTREKHAFLIFEPKKRQFFLRGGDGSGLTYCNDEMVTAMVPLKAYDKLQLGDAEFLFVPFCGEQFMWDEK